MNLSIHCVADNGETGSTFICRLEKVHSSKGRSIHEIRRCMQPVLSVRQNQECKMKFVPALVQSNLHIDTLEFHSIVFACAESRFVHSSKV